MILSSSNPSPKQKSNWREKLWRISSSLSTRTTPSHYSLQRTPKGSPKLPQFSDSPTLTPGSINQHKQEESVFLTPLDVLDHDHEVNSLLDNQIGMIFGDWSIPPPPPRKRTNSNPNTHKLLPAKTFSGPKVKPYVTTSSRIDLNINQETCFICNDVLETKLDSEKLVPLECGDCLHSECLHANVDMLLEKSILEGAFNNDASEVLVELKVLPVCRGSYCVSQNKLSAVIPIDKHIVADLMADAMLSVKLATMSKDLSSRDTSDRTSLAFGVENRVSRHFFIEKQLLRPKSMSDGLWQQGHTTNIANRTSSAGVLLEDSVSTMKTLEEVKNAFIKHMLNRYSEFNLVVLVSLGTLRLVDKLLVAFGDGKLCENIVYLFSNFIVIETEGATPTLFPLNGEHAITTPEISVIQFVSKQNQTPSLKLYSETDAIIEKWGIALSDHLLLLPSDVITSSIDIDELSVNTTKQNVTEPQVTGKNKFDLKLPLKRLVDPRISMVLVIEPREIWSRGPDKFTEELMRIGVMPITDLHSDSFSTHPTSPLNITRSQKDEVSLQFPMSHEKVAIESDTDSDSDQELINEVMLKRKT